MLVQGEVPLKSIKISAILHNSLVSLSITQQYTNTSQNPIECEYKLPVIEEGVITDLTILLQDGTRLKSDLLEKNSALEKYQDKLSQGHTVAMLRQSKDSDVKISIGNLQPNDSVTILINATFPMQSQENNWTVSIPSGFIPISETLHGPIYQLEFQLDLISSGPITDYSSNWPLVFATSISQTNLSGTISAPDFIPSQHFAFKYRSGIVEPTCLLQQISGRYAAMLSFVPYSNHNESIDDLESTAEYLFVLDRSGSMEGRRIELATKAAALFLKSLPPQSKFNIVSFGSDYAFMHSESVIADEHNVGRSIELVGKYTADMGGTDIYRPLEAVFRIPMSNDYPRFIFLLTDGDVSDVDRVVALIQSQSAFCRVNGFGIEDANPRLINSASQAGKGTAYFINNPSEISRKVISALSLCMVPCISRWEIDWPGDPVPKAQEFGIIKYGERFLQYALLDSLPSQPAVLRAYDTCLHGYKEFSISLTSCIEGDQIFKLWAKNKIKDLVSTNQSKEEVLKVSLEFKVLSPYTSLICVKENEEGTSDDMRFIALPLLKENIGCRDDNIYFKAMMMEDDSEGELYEMEEDSDLAGGIPQQYYPEAVTCCMSMAPDERYGGAESSELIDSSLYSRMIVSYGAESESMKPNELTMQIDLEKEQEKSCGIDAMTIIFKQSSDGFWKWEEIIGIMPGLNGLSEKAAISEIAGRIYATAYALCYLQTKCIGSYDEWVLIEKKALRWLKKHNASYEDLIQEVLAFIMP